VSKSPLPLPLAPLFETREPEARVQRVWRGIESRRRRRPVPRAPQIIAAAFIASSVAFGAWLLGEHARRSSDAPPVLVERSVEAGEHPRALNFGQGARVTVGPGARLDVLEQSADGVTLALRRGLAQFDIQPGGVRRWKVESAGIAVEVVGTQFSVERSQSTVRVEVQRGRVLVRGAEVPDRVQSLEAGRVLAVETGREQPVAPVPPTEPAQPAAEPVPRAPEPEPPPAGASPSALFDSAPSWRKAASEQDWQRAWDALGPDGLARQTRQTDSVEDLFTLADVARRSGHPAAAIGPLEEIVTRHPKDPRASVASFTLGRVQLDALGNPGQAVLAFQRALALELPQTLAEDAEARLVEALARSGRTDAARAAAEQYRRHHPDGARRGDVDRWSPAR
jgi:transmembrane sensor